MYPHVVGEIVRLTGCSQAEAERAVEAVGMDTARAIEWLRARDVIQ